VLLARIGSPGAPLWDASRLNDVFPGAKARAALGTDRGTAFVAAGFHATLQKGARFIAAWTRGARTFDGDSPPSVRQVRAGALIVVTPRGLEVSRGPYGGQSLYYAATPGGGPLVVSSSLASLLAALGSRPAFDVDRLAALAVMAIGTDPGATIYKGVRRVLPCETIAFTADGQRSWFNVPPVPARLPSDPRGHAVAMREMIAAILERELCAFGAVAVATGGGLDSSGLLALVARYAAASGSLRFTGLTMDFASPGDDRPHLAKLLAALDAPTIRVRADELEGLSEEAFVEDGAPYNWPTAAIDLAGRRRAKAWGAEATVSGGGGDQVLDGDDSSFARRALAGDVRAVVDAARLQVPYPSSMRRRVARFVVNPLVRPYLPKGWLHRRRSQALAGAAYAQWAGPTLRRQLTATLAIPAELSEEWVTGHALSTDLMESADVRHQAELACGLPQVEPYLDPDFIDLVASFPPEELFSGGRTRGLFRDAMEGLLPDSLRLRRDKAEFSPLVDESFAQLGGVDAFRHLLTMEASADLGIVEPVPFRACFDRIVAGDRVHYGWLNVWPALGVEAFLRSISRASKRVGVGHE